MAGTGSPTVRRLFIMLHDVNLFVRDLDIHRFGYSGFLVLNGITKLDPVNGG